MRHGPGALGAAWLLLAALALSACGDGTRQAVPAASATTVSIALAASAEQGASGASAAQVTRVAQGAQGAQGAQRAQARPDASTAPATVPSTRLAYFTEKDGVYRLQFWQAGNASPETIDLMLDPPLALVWAPAQRQLASIRADGIYSVDYSRPPYAAKWRGEAPPKGARLIDAWFASPALESIKAVTASPAGAGRARCSYYEAGPTGPWRKLEEQADDEAAGGAGCAGFADARHAGAGSVSSARLMRAYQCAERGSLCDRADPGLLPNAFAAELLAARRQLDSVSALRLAPGGPVWLVGIASGDTPHFHQPLAWLQPGAAKPTTLSLPTAAQMQLGVAGDLLLAASEYAGQNPVVLDTRSGKIVFRAAGVGAVWVPAVGP